MKFPRSFFGLPFALALTGCLGGAYPKTPAHGGPAWQEITTEHFVVATNLDPAEADAMVRQLENLRRAMGETVFGGEPGPAPPMRVLALRQEEYGHYDRINAGTFVFNSLFQPMLITSPGGDWDTFSSDVRKHELAHYLSSLYIDIRLQPKWFSEGLAEYMETTRYDEKTGAVEIGRRSADYEYLEFAQHATPEELWAWDAEIPYAALTARLYSTSWAIVHYLFDQRADELLDYQRALVRGDDAREAWNRIFPDLDNAGLADTVKKYIHKRDHKVKKAKVPPVAVTTKVSPLSEADVLAWRGILHMALHSQSKRNLDESKKLAKDNVDASLAQNPSSFWAHQANLFYFEKVPGSVNLAKRTISTEQNNWLAWLWYSEVLRQAKRPPDERRAAITKALELAPSNRLALTQLAWIEANAGNWPASLDAASKAVHSAPVLNDSILAYSYALSYSGHCNDARTVEEQLAKRLKGKVPKETAEVLKENHDVCAAGGAATAANAPVPAPPTAPPPARVKARAK